jgi:hypothetical protein
MNVNDLFKASFGSYGSVYLNGDGAQLDLNDDAFGAVTNLGDNDALAITTSHVFPKGITIYGKWDFIELNGGACLCYLAPVGY